jgi:ADP-ribose pyrophosphatase
MDETVRKPLIIEPGDLVYQDRNQVVSRIKARFDGFSKEYFVSDHGQRVAVLLIRGDEILLIRQYRLLINDISYEIPGGRADEGEPLEAAAARECLEECGFRCWNLKLLMSYHASLDILKNYTTIFFSEDFEESGKPGSLRHEWIPLPRCLDMIFKRQIVDSLSILALLAYDSGKFR